MERDGPNVKHITLGALDKQGKNACHAGLNLALGGCWSLAAYMHELLHVMGKLSGITINTLFRSKPIKSTKFADYCS